MAGVSFDTASAPFGKVDESRSNDQMIHLDELQVGLQPSKKATALHILGEGFLKRT